MPRIAKHASTDGVDLLVCPEMYLTGYNIGIDAARELAESSDGTSAQAVAETARENSVAIIYGYPERGSEDVIFNSAQLFTANGSPLAKRLLINNTLVMAGRGRVVERARSSIRRGSRGDATRVVR